MIRRSYISLACRYRSKLIPLNLVPVGSLDKSEYLVVRDTYCGSSQYFPCSIHSTQLTDRTEIRLNTDAGVLGGRTNRSSGAAIDDGRRLVATQPIKIRAVDLLLAVHLQPAGHTFKSHESRSNQIGHHGRPYRHSSSTSGRCQRSQSKMFASTQSLDRSSTCMLTKDLCSIATGISQEALAF
jgi:hypothetical protein